MINTDVELTVRYAETDKMGIVHHSNYAVWFEVGRTNLLKKLGAPYSEIEKNLGVWLPLIGLKCKFIGHAEFEDVVVIRTKIKKYNGVRLILGYEVFKKENLQLITTGETEHACTSHTLKPVNLRKYRPELHDLLTSAMNDDK